MIHYSTANRTNPFQTFPEATCSIDDDTLTFTDQNGSLIAVFTRIYITHWWIWVEETARAA
jgi:hypothetical protein